jgi:hypothetical protein
MMDGINWLSFIASRAALLLGSAVAGAIVGFGVLQVKHLPELFKYPLIGAIAGLFVAILALLIGRRRETLLLEKVKITVPELAELTFAVSGEHRKVAWKIFIEIMTRVATQPLGPQEGLLREAFSSLYSIFLSIRELLKTTEPARPTAGPTVEMFAFRMLNKEIRPFLAKWHPELKRFEQTTPPQPETAWEHNNICRGELRQLQDRLVEYGHAFGKLADVKRLEEFFENPSTTLIKKPFALESARETGNEAR